MGYTLEKVVRIEGREIVYRATAPTAHEAVSMLQLACGVAVIEPQPTPFVQESLNLMARQLDLTGEMIARNGSVDADRPFVRGVT